jgi:hypothetical protein
MLIYITPLSFAVFVRGPSESKRLFRLMPEARICPEETRQRKPATRNSAVLYGAGDSSPAISSASLSGRPNVAAFELRPFL